MNLKTYFFVALLILAALANPASARQDPTPPPSGIVVHLFGPDSITSHILPTTPSPGVAAATAGGGGTQSGSPAAYSEPTAGDLLHQMFVTGDPNEKPGEAMAPGRAAEHPPALNP